MYRRITLIALTGFVFFFGSLIPTGAIRRQPGEAGRRPDLQTVRPPSVPALFHPTDAYARRGFGGRGFGRSFGGFRSSRSLWNRRSRSRSSSLFSFGSRRTNTPKRTPSTVTPRRGTGLSSGAARARSTGAARARGGTIISKRSAMASRVKRTTSKNALQTYRSRQSRFARPSNPAANTSEYKNNPIYARGSANRVSYNRYYDRRDAYYQHYGWQPPSYVYMGRSSFGMWDALIWWSILDRLNDPGRYAMAYHHAGDPGYKEWRSEADSLAKDNKELRQKLKELDQKVATLKGTPPDSTYLPPGVDPAIALAAEVVAAADPGLPKLRVGTGVPNGNYQRFGKIMQSHLPDFNVTLLPSNGSIENLDNFTADKCDAILVQSDMLNAYLREHPTAGDRLVGLQSTLYTEFVQLLVNEDSGITGIGDLDPKKNVVYVGPKGSGTQGAWKGFVMQDSRYGEFNTRNASYEEALRQVAAHPEAVMLFVGGLHSGLLKTANDKYGDRVNLVSAGEPRFTTALDQFGNQIYTMATIPSETYPNIQDGWIFGWFGDSSVKTLKVEAVLILSQHWVDTYGSRPMTVVEDAVWQSIDEIEPIVGE